MSISLVSNVFNTVAIGTPVTVLASGNYTIQEMQVILTGINENASTNGAFSYQARLVSGANTIMSIDAVGQTAEEPTQLHRIFSQSFADPLILTPNTALTLICDVATLVIGARLVINISGFKK